MVSIASMPNLKRRTASDDIFGRQKFEIVSTTCSSSSFTTNSNLFNSSSESDESAEIKPKVLTRYDRNVMYRSVSADDIHLEKESYV